ncbi:MAG: LacI family DNA-binding transcriptional regulator [[Pasteurella] mairii]|uniref:Transcriptional regulator GntR n=1 Tax=[Pasteurella] mairii TaxID=757 RepID=A0A379B722_9PAST|nr:LacI family DNA-binding transcriptional regulator [[Pasteurella] mairii]SUB33890.1 transcriptional regulator GntR [[Pasteurella] mairii]
MRIRRSTGKTTLADVAKKAGVGQMTVSRAIRTPQLVSEPLRKKIQEVIQQLGYIPNISARNLASVSSGNIVVVTASITSTENTLIFDALQKQLQSLDRQLIILLATGQDWLNELINHSPAAIVLLNFNCSPKVAQWIKESQILCIEVGAKQENPIGINICIDSKNAVQTLLSFLINKGYREIGLLCAKQELAIFQQYLESWHTTLLANHLNPHLILHSAEPISFSSGAKLLEEALLLWGKIDALVFLSDELACGALFEAARRHVVIPHNMAIVGLGNLDVSTVSYPKLTTISVPYKKLGMIAGKKLVELLRTNEKNIQEVIQLPISLIERETS